MKKTMTILLKFAGAGLLIWGIAFTFMVVSPEDEKALVKTANADIFTFGEATGESKFEDAIKSMGIKARPYDFNGNIIYFGTSRLHDSSSLDETANKIQRQLVHSGVNKKNYAGYETELDAINRGPRATKTEASNKERTEYQEAMLAGELVPTRKGKDVFEMSGVTGLGSIDAYHKKISAIPKSEKKGKRLKDYINGYRYIEVRQKEGSNMAEILAVWTDDKFSADKFTNEDGVQQSPPDPKIPACRGCKRSRRVQALDKSEPYNINKWVTRSTIDETYNFYLKSMNNRGWKETGKQKKINKLAELLPEVAGIVGKGLSLERGGEVIEIAILPYPKGGAQIFSLEKYSDTQPTLEELPVEPNSPIRDTISRIFE